MPLTFTKPQDETSLPNPDLPTRTLLAARSLKGLGDDCFYGRDFPSGGNSKFRDTDPLCVALFGNSNDDKDRKRSSNDDLPARKLSQLRSLKELGDDCYYGKDFPSGGNGDRKFKKTDPLCVALFGNGNDNSGRRRGSQQDRKDDEFPARKLQAVRSLMELGREDCFYGRDFPSGGKDDSKFKKTDPLCVALFGNGNDNNRRRQNRRGAPDLD